MNVVNIKYCVVAAILSSMVTSFIFQFYIIPHRKEEEQNNAYKAFFTLPADFVKHAENSAGHSK